MFRIYETSKVCERSDSISLIKVLFLSLGNIGLNNGFHFTNLILALLKYHFSTQNILTLFMILQCRFFVFKYLIRFTRDQLSL